jgi:hypothetical protein
MSYGRSIGATSPFSINSANAVDRDQRHDDRMGNVHPFPRRGSVFVDARGEQRTMRVACHQDEGVVVISLWAAGVCRASFRLPAALAPEVAGLLAACGGDEAPGPRVTDLIDRSPPAQVS